ncbi:MerR family transcriptional regulator [candidate division KSB1 bacterium]|nr:MerR family transcriptional regulator [Phycisphaerae bacterium]NIP51082.1 MerR family transcriptional regulator [Phycisphaerae bacterium]NIV92136.1 MerR family transcriptional regulator [candidate division KSB1 bacterium]NIX31944.1 MerR family transcriptional regulator [Phycisphaerae bacterium]
MYVNDLAQKVGVPVDTVRYYTRRQLLVPKICPENGYKIFSNDDVHRLQFISRAKQYGFTLNEIRLLLEQIMEGDSACSSVRDLLKRHIKENESKIAELQRMQTKMEKALIHWDYLPDEAPNEKVWCPLIESNIH